MSKSCLYLIYHKLIKIVELNTVIISFFFQTAQTPIKQSTTSGPSFTDLFHSKNDTLNLNNKQPQTNIPTSVTEHDKPIFDRNSFDDENTNDDSFNYIDEKKVANKNKTHHLERLEEDPGSVLYDEESENVSEIDEFHGDRKAFTYSTTLPTTIISTKLNTKTTPLTTSTLESVIGTEKMSSYWSKSSSTTTEPTTTISTTTTKETPSTIDLIPIVNETSTLKPSTNTLTVTEQVVKESTTVSTKGTSISKSTTSKITDTFFGGYSSSTPLSQVTISDSDNNTTTSSTTTSSAKTFKDIYSSSTASSTKTIPIIATSTISDDTTTSTLRTIAVPEVCSPPPVVCTTNRCKQVGSRLLALMNNNIDPCVDFHEYTCGGAKINKIDTKPENDENVLGIDFADLVNVFPNRTYVTNFVDYYDSCMTMERSEMSNYCK